MVWSTAAMGIMIGYGYYAKALVLDFVIVVLENLHSLTVTAMIDERLKITDVYDTIRKYESIVALDIEGI